VEKPKTSHVIIGEFTYPNEQFRGFKKINEGHIVNPHPVDKKNQNKNQNKCYARSPSII